jgi:DNA-binding CsgD family transcriptional regulator
MAKPCWKPRRSAPLTERELAVLRLIADGLTDQAIACALDVTPRTVRFHRRHLYDKTGCDNEVHLTRYAIAHGLVPIPWAPPGDSNMPVTSDSNIQAGLADVEYQPLKGS